MSSLLGFGVISTDDLGEAARAVTDPVGHADLHAFQAQDHREYYIAHSVVELINDAQRAHRAFWPAIRSVIRAHLHWGRPAIIEGWAILPDLVAQAGFNEVSALWLDVPAASIESRVRADVGFYGGASDPERMIRQFVGRSVAFSSWLQQQTSTLRLPYLQLSGTESPDEVAELCLRTIGVNSAVN
ncbi:MAG TPA: hypothetical protein VMZ31_15790 [Phycisphaerae bacterium]|nr:hypothetical protein [Phycisphaerae bacterium]